MLCQFSVKNYKSIRDEITLDMQAAAISEHADRIIRDSDEQLFLPVAAIYGPNGGGKSNVLEALQALGTMVLKPIHATKQNRVADYKFNRYPVKPFVFSDEGKNSPTEFEILFRTENAAKYSLEQKLLNTDMSFTSKRILLCMKVWIELSWKPAENQRYFCVKKMKSF